MTEPGRQTHGRTLRIARVLIALALLLGGAASATRAATTLVPVSEQSASGDVSDGGRRGFDAVVEQALTLLDRKLRTARASSCLEYFERYEVDLLAWVGGGGPPYIKVVRPRGKMARTTCGAAQGAPPFTYIFVRESCFDRTDPCPLASLLLHEMGHLARRDGSDNEPLEFFSSCRLNACVDAGSFR